MRLSSSKLALGLLFSMIAVNANATLTSYTGAGGAELVYSSVSNITWTKDANLFKTMYDANNNLIGLIAAVTPSYNDSAPIYGLQIIDAGDFNTSGGSMTWWGAKAFVNYLNSITYGGSDQWRLPTSNAIFGYDGTAGNELGQLFYDELGGTADNNIPNTATFKNERVATYWSGSEYAPSPDFVWDFKTSYGGQYTADKSSQFFAWAVSPGQLAAVPVPAAAWLFGSALLVNIVASMRRGHTG